MGHDLIDALRDGLPAEVVVDDPDRVESFRFDKAQFCPAGIPAAVVLVRERAHVEHTLRTASRLGVPVVPQGARSGLSGAANAIDGCVVLSLERMDHIVEIDPANRIAVVEPGVFNAVLSRAVGEHGLFYPPDPSSWEFCTIGGNLATNSGGLCCVKYGVTTDYVRGLEVVLASGEVVTTGRRTVKGVAGYDLTKLFVGSEGTLGVITQAILGLRPETERPRTIGALFDSPASAAAAVSAVMAAGHVPSLLEIMDATCIRAVDDMKRMDLPADAGAMLLAQSDRGPAAAEEIAAIGDLFRQAGATDVVEAVDPAEGELLLEARRVVLLALERLGTTLIDDVCVPLSRLSDLFEGVEKIAATHGVLIGVVGHAGDGNMHPTVVFDASDEAAVRLARRAYGAVMELSLELGGTITGEHGIGVLKKPWLAAEIGPVGMRLHRDIKRVLDPQNILNPGKVFDVAEPG
ncbi:MAG: FAD-linked oxidase C-terminal domain-containing protein [Jiangellaceae bacterium]